MKEFNENPFKKDTPVEPFSNGMKFMDWTERNCEQCTKYENKSTTEDESGCKLAFHLDLGTMKGTIPLWAAKEIGCRYDPLYQTCQLVDVCRHYLSK